MNTDKIKQYRLRLKLTQSQVADLIGVKKRAYQYKEAGEVCFSIEEVKVLLKIFGCTFEDIAY